MEEREAVKPWNEMFLLLFYAFNHIRSRLEVNLRRFYWFYFGISWMIWLFLTKTPFDLPREPLYLGVVVFLSKIYPTYVDLVEKAVSYVLIRGP